MVDRIANCEMAGYVRNLREFNNSKESAYGRNEGRMYVAYSYGRHFPMYAYDHEAKLWIGNKDKYSPTTSRHQSQAHPGHIDLWLKTSDMRAVVEGRGVVEYVRLRMRRAAGRAA